MSMSVGSVIAILNNASEVWQPSVNRLCNRLYNLWFYYIMGTVRFNEFARRFLYDEEAAGCCIFLYGIRPGH